MDLTASRNVDVLKHKEGAGDKECRSDLFRLGHCLIQMGSAKEFMKRDSGPKGTCCDISELPTSFN